MLAAPLFVERGGASPVRTREEAVANNWRGDLVLRPWTLALIALLPLLAFTASELILERSALNFEWMPKYFGEFDANRAEALRLSAFGAFFLFSACALGAFLYFLYTLRRLQRTSAVIVLGLFVLANLIIGSMLVPATTTQADKFVGSPLVCKALGYNAEQSRQGMPDPKTPEAKIRPVQVKVPEKPAAGTPCSEATLEPLNWLLGLNKLGVLLGLTSLVFGAILCLAGPASNVQWGQSEELAHYEDQSDQLNTYLYLSALLLVTGLFFISAVFRWPTHALLTADSASYETHVGALVTFYGFAYTVMLASFYIPVAISLSAQVKRLKPATVAEAGVPAAFKGPLQLLKIAAAIFSTTLAGILSSLVSFGS